MGTDKTSTIDFIDRFRNGDPDAFVAVYDEYATNVAKLVMSLLRRYSGSSPATWSMAAVDVRDLVQESFVRAFEGRERFDGIRDYGPYVVGIARNVVMSHLRSQYRRRDVPTDPWELSTWVQPSQENDFADAQTTAIVDRYLAQLPVELKRLHEVLYVQGVSQREAASMLGLGRQTVRTLDARLRHGLHAELATSSWTDAHAEKRRSE